MSAKAILRVDFVPGVSIGDAATEAVRLANALGVWVEGSFNGVTFIAQPGGDPGRVAQRWSDECERRRKGK